MSKTKYEGWILIPAYIHNAADLNESEKILWGHINGLTNSTGYCFATNQYLADATGVSTRAIQRRLNSLVEKKYLVRSEISTDNGQTKRIIRVANPAEGGTTPASPPHDASVTHTCIQVDNGDTEKVNKGKQEVSKKNNKKNESTKYEDDEQIMEVYDFWASRRKRAMNIPDHVKPPTVNSRKRGGRIRARLRDGYTVDMLKEAIVGCLEDEFYTKGGHTDLNLILRPGKVDEFRRKFASRRADRDKPKERRRDRSGGEMRRVSAPLPWIE